MWYEKGYVKHVTDLVSELQAVLDRSETTTMKLADQKTKLGELDMKVYLLDEEARRASDLKKGLDGKVCELESATKALESKEYALKERSSENGRLDMKPGTARAAIGRMKGVIYDITEWAGTAYKFRTDEQSSSYRLNFELGDEQTRENPPTDSVSASKRMGPSFILGMSSVRRSIWVTLLRTRAANVVMFL